MCRDPLVRKARELCRQTAQCPLGVILEATVWLEETYERTPHAHTAIVIALHYLLLAMRQEPRSRPTLAKEYFSRAVRWREEAHRLIGKHYILSGQQSRN